jgi:hypothetical protein
LKRKKVLLLVVDGCTPRVLHAGLAAGVLPNLERLIAAGFYDPACVAIFPSITPAATASIVTGRPPAEHGIVGAHWYDEDSGEVVYYGDDLTVIRQQGIGRWFDRLLVGMNDRRLRAETLFETSERAGLCAACINYPVFRGVVEHEARVPFLLRLVPGVPSTRFVPGPSWFFLGDFISTPLPATGKHPRHAGGLWHRFGMDDAASADVLAALVRAGLPHLTVAYFPDYDFRSHDVGPWEALPALEGFDRHLGRVFAAAGGLDLLLRDCCVVLTADHSHSTTREGEGARVPLARVLEGYEIADAGRRRAAGEPVKVCVNLRNAQLYLRRWRAEVAHDLILRLLAEHDVDQVFWRTPARLPTYHVATRDRGWLVFWRGAGGRNAVHDDWGQWWSFEGNPGAVAADVAADSTVRSREYPNPFERICGGLDAPEGGDLWVTARPGAELILEETEAHRGAGSHGSLHVTDSLVPLIAAGLPKGLAPPERTRTIDVAPLCRAVLGL